MTTDFDQHSRRELFRRAALGGGAAALFGGLGVNPMIATALAKEAGASPKPLKAAFSNAGLQATWCAQGKQAAEYWGKLFNVDVTWFDGELDAVKQRAAIDNMASQKWDFVAIQAFGIGTLTAPVNKMIDAGMPVIDMDTLIAPLDTINVHTFLAPDNEFMGASVTQALVDAISGEGTMTMTQGALGHTGAQGRAQRLPVGRHEIPEDRGARRAARRLGRHQGRAHLGDAADQISEDRRRVLPQRRHGARRLQRDEGARAAPRSRSAAATRCRRRSRRCRTGAMLRDRPQSVLPHPWRRHRRRRAAVVDGEKTGPAASRRTSSPTGRWSPRPTPTA